MASEWFPTSTLFSDMDVLVLALPGVPVTVETFLLSPIGEDVLLEFKSVTLEADEFVAFVTFLPFVIWPVRAWRPAGAPRCAPALKKRGAAIEAAEKKLQSVRLWTAFT